MARKSNYDKFPFVEAGKSDQCTVGWDAIAAQLAGKKIVCVECYPGANVDEVESNLVQRLRPDSIIRASDGYKPAAEIRAMLAPHLGDDRVFGRMNGLTLEAWFDGKVLNRMREEVAAASSRGTVLLVGSGATLLAPEFDALVYADMARWEIQLRYRRFE